MAHDGGGAGGSASACADSAAGSGANIDGWCSGSTENDARESSEKSENDDLPVLTSEKTTDGLRSRHASASPLNIPGDSGRRGTGWQSSGSDSEVGNIDEEKEEMLLLEPNGSSWSMDCAKGEVKPSYWSAVNWRVNDTGVISSAAAMSYSRGSLGDCRK